MSYVNRYNQSDFETYESGTSGTLAQISYTKTFPPIFDRRDLAVWIKVMVKPTDIVGENLMSTEDYLNESRDDLLNIASDIDAVYAGDIQCGGVVSHLLYVHDSEFERDVLAEYAQQYKCWGFNAEVTYTKDKDKREYLTGLMESEFVNQYLHTQHGLEIIQKAGYNGKDPLKLFFFASFNNEPKVDDFIDWLEQSGYDVDGAFLSHDDSIATVCFSIRRVLEFESLWTAVDVLTQKACEYGGSLYPWACEPLGDTPPDWGKGYDPRACRMPDAAKMLSCTTKELLAKIEGNDLFICSASDGSHCVTPCNSFYLGRPH